MDIVASTQGGSDHRYTRFSSFNQQCSNSKSHLSVVHWMHIITVITKHSTLVYAVI